MNNFLTITLYLHIAAGFTALTAGLIAILSKKGKNVHRGGGKTFFYSMLAVSFSALLISVIKSNAFLLHIGIFSLYMNYSGYRSVHNKSLQPSRLDWFFLLMAIVNGIFMIISLNAVLMVFGAINTFLTVGDLRIFFTLIRKKPIPKIQWLLRHIGMMMGTYIATSTAFIVVNVKHVEPAWLPWLLPTFIGSPLIAFWSRKYTGKIPSART